MRSIFLAILLLIGCVARAQFSNITLTNAEALQVMKGLYDPADYAATTVINDHEEILCALRTEVNADSLRYDLEVLTSY
ncbi:MAG TPA: hypothetical protein PK760_13470, partial [Flavobacteriales bacterium]|nr:hypothetical protein [Flavobacteriales bacterium]